MKILQGSSIQIRLFYLTAILFILGSWTLAPNGSAQTSAALSNTKKEAEAKGYIFVDSHDEIVNRAKKEGRLNVVVSLSQDILSPVNVAFRKKYPFIDSRAVGVRGNEVYLRLLEELKAGLTKNQDVNDLVADYYTEYLPYQKKSTSLEWLGKESYVFPPPWWIPLTAM
jgi:hypothetical protein